jgi:cytochrome b561
MQVPDRAYDPATRWLHWGSAAFFLLLFGLGLAIDWVPRGEPKIMVRSVHIVLGLLLTLLLVYRMVWRRRHGLELPAVYLDWRAKGVEVFHLGLYLVMVAMVTSGIVAVWFRGVNLFDLLTIPAFDPSNKPMRRLLVNIHEIIAYGLLGLAALHALFALWHHYRLKDGVLQRMWPSLQHKSAEL